MSIVYSNFKTAINAVSIVASESAELIVENAVLKTSVLENGEGEGEYAESDLEKIDYANGKPYRDIHK